MKIPQIVLCCFFYATTMSNSVADTFTDKFSRTSVDGWGGSWQGETNTYALSTNGSEGVFEHTTPGGRSTVLISDVARDQDVYMKATFHESPPSSGYTDIGIMLRVDEQNDTYYASRLRWSQSSKRLIIERRISGAVEILYNELLNLDDSSREFGIRFSVVGEVPKLSAKVWDNDLPEPRFAQADIVDRAASAITSAGKSGVRSAIGSETPSAATITVDNYVSSSKSAPETQLYKCPVNWSIRGTGHPFWNSYGCLGQISSVSTCSTYQFVRDVYYENKLQCEPL